MHCLVLFVGLKISSDDLRDDLKVTTQPALHMRPTRVSNGFLYGAFVAALYGPQSVFANGFLMGPIWFINKGHIWAPYGAFIVK